MFLSTLSQPESRAQLRRVWQLSIPAVLTQITTIAMQYIDSAMVGNLGANASAAIGLVSTTTWLLGGIGGAVAAGFGVQVAQHIGADQPQKARQVVRYGFLAGLLAAIVLMVASSSISGVLPQWLGGEQALWKDASAYFLVFALTIPFMELNRLAASFLQNAGNMVVPSILNAVMCLLDVVFNAFFIPRHGVLGAAIGTGLSVVVICLVQLWFCLFQYPPLRLRTKERFTFDRSIYRRALKIGLPIGAESVAMSGAYVASTVIIAPLGTIAIAAHSFAITAESLCYMPGYGIGTAATTLVGQSIGAKDYPLARRYGYITTAFGGIMMALTGIVMFFACPLVFRLLTPVDAVRTVGVQILRIGLLAEPLYGVSIAASGALRGAEDTFIPSLMNLFSMWVVRLGLAVMLVPRFGIHGMWIAMATELCVRGLILLHRQLHSKYLKPDLI